MGNKRGSLVSVVDLFAGMGGFGVAAESLKCDVKLSVELDKTCCETLSKNMPRNGASVLQADVSTILGRELRRRAGISVGEPFVLVGGAPCQPFSKAAYWTDPGLDAKYRRARASGKRARKPKPISKARPDDRRDLVQEFARLVIESKPQGLVFENVTSILHPRNMNLFSRFVTTLENAGYAISWCKLNAADFGVAQKRERVFVMGSKYGVPAVPVPTHIDDHTPVRDVIGEYSSAAYREDGEVVTGRWAEHLRTVPPGWNYKAHTAWAGHPRPTFVTETRFWNFLLKLDPKEPSWTIAANPGPWTGPFHWRSRRLRTPELLAIQSFPGDYILCGNRRERVRQIGNAVPPALARYPLSSVLATLK